MQKYLQIDDGFYFFEKFLIRAALLWFWWCGVDPSQFEMSWYEYRVEGAVGLSFEGVHVAV